MCTFNFVVWLDTRTKSTVDHFEATATEKTREHVRVSLFVIIYSKEGSSPLMSLGGLFR